ncbi:MAG: hypothetical protein H0X46_07510, partial [Bacteroidetes bacterium]|nr:hypothetical protein [Bacteroidota bacterium]
MSRVTCFVDVILPLAVPNLYTYRVPYDWNNSIAVGTRVIVQFGRSKLYSALVRRIHQNPPKQYAAKYIDSILDETPIVNEKQFELWEWMSQYYMCNIGDVMVAALPGGLRLASETKVVLNPAFTSKSKDDRELPLLSDKEVLIIDALEIRNVLSLQDISEIIEQKTVYPLIKSMIEKGVVFILEELKEKFKPKIESYVCFTASADDEDNLKNIFDALERKAPKQLDTVMAYINLSKRYSKERIEVKKSDVFKMVDGAEAALKSLVKKDIFEIYEREVGRLANYKSENKISSLNEVQQDVLESIKKQFGADTKTDSLIEATSLLNANTLSIIPAEGRGEVKDVVLLHGVTSSGKTEIYVKLIEEAIAKGKQV